MKEQGKPGIYGIDTRQLTKHIRHTGTSLGKIVVEGSDEDPPFKDPNLINLVQGVSSKVSLPSQHPTLSLIVLK